MNRDEKVLSIRPNLDLGGKDKTDMELFQNGILRPILKLQHELTLSLLGQHRNYKLDKVKSMTKDQYDEFINKYLQSNVDLKNQLLGTVIALFTSDDMGFYVEHKKEIHKRIIQMQKKRFVDTFAGGEIVF
jgi:hypothetical protein